jgi:S1-C subfamily serine protease
MRSIRVCIAAVVFALVVAAALFAAPRSIAPSVWPMTFNGHNGCTVTSINEGQRYWLTAAHCVDPSEDEGPTIRAIRGEVITPVVVDTKQDIAIVQTGRGAPALKLAMHPPTVPLPGAKPRDSEVFVLGYPFGLPFLVNVRGQAAALAGVLGDDDPKPYALFNLTGAPGNSGSAILNSKGEVVSVLQVGWGRSWSPIVGGAVFAELDKYRRYFEQ